MNIANISDIWNDPIQLEMNPCTTGYAPDASTIMISSIFDRINAIHIKIIVNRISKKNNCSDLESGRLRPSFGRFWKKKYTELPPFRADLHTFQNLNVWQINEEKKNEYMFYNLRLLSVNRFDFIAVGSSLRKNKANKK